MIEEVRGEGRISESDGQAKMHPRDESVVRGIYIIQFIVNN